LSETYQVLVSPKGHAACRVCKPAVLDLAKDAMRAQEPQYLPRPAYVYARLSGDFFHDNALFFRHRHNSEEAKLKGNLEGGQVIARAHQASHCGPRADDEQT
jgi:hypothetical protein